MGSDTRPLTLGGAMARTLIVSTNQPGAYPSIRDALELAENGDTISIASGTYPEPLRLDGRKISLVAADVGEVVIAVRGTGEPTVSCRGSDVTLRGLVIRSDDATAVQAVSTVLHMTKCEASAGYGAGISVANGSSLTGTDVRVTGGQVGLIFEDAGGTLDKCEVTGVSDDGIIVRLGADPTIRNSTITGCGFRGIYIYQAAKP